jgi:hypothetical protein
MQPFEKYKLWEKATIVYTSEQRMHLKIVFISFKKNTTYANNNSADQL